VTIEAALYTYLSTHAGLSALIGTRIYPYMVAQGAKMPAVAYQLVDDIPVHSSVADVKVHAARFQFSCWGGGTSGYTSACAVAAQIKSALQDYSGTMGGAGGVVVQHCYLELTTDLYDETMERCGRAVDITIWHEGS
jgi:hypothetical protein